MIDAVALVQAYIRAVEAFDAEAAAPLLAEEMQFEELPNRIRPKGGVDGKAAMMAALRRSGERKLLSGQRYVLGDIIASGERVVVEARWEGDLVVPVGALPAGGTMVAHICMVFEVQQGRIVRQRNYDCYEPFEAV